jgi:hypothetical protein
MITLSDTLVHYYQDKKWILDGPDYTGLIWISDDCEKPTENELNLKKAELESAEPLRLLREQRNQLLAQSDWMALSDRTMTQAQIDYRQALRDLPTTAEPQLDEDGNLTNVTWPERTE